MIAVDTNIAIHAHRVDSPWHAAAAARLRELAEGSGAWALPWPCVHEFLAVVTHPRIYRPPTPVVRAVAQVDAWLESPTLVLLGEADGHWQSLKALATAGKIDEPQFHDFSRFPGLRVVNPLIG